jgi:NhaA family Na+:H+ antiporter
MSENRPDGVELTRLPAGFVDRLAKPFADFLRIESAAGLILLSFTIVALVLSNSPWAHPFLNAWEIPLGIRVGSLELSRSGREWINDALMTLFFFVVALELKRELVLGELRNRRIAALSVAAALGGMLVPAALYAAMMSGQPGEMGWGTVMATDTAFVVGCLALLGPRIPQSLRLFMLSLAIVDDIGAIVVVAIGYSAHMSWRALAFAVVGIAIVRGLALLGVRSIGIYFALGGLIWLAVDASGIHGTVTGVLLGLLTPTRRWVSDERLHAILGRVAAYPAGDYWGNDAEDLKVLSLARTAARETLSPVERLEMMLHPWIAFVVMPLFALANAGLPISVVDLRSPVTLAVFIGLALGKPMGISAFSWVAVRSGLAIRPEGLSWKLLATASLLAGIGFTMALFIANLAFTPALINPAKLGILGASVLSAVAGVALLAVQSSRGTKS